MVRFAKCCNPIPDDQSLVCYQAAEYRFIMQVKCGALQQIRNVRLMFHGMTVCKTNTMLLLNVGSDRPGLLHEISEIFSVFEQM